MKTAANFIEIRDVILHLLISQPMAETFACEADESTHVLFFSFSLSTLQRFVIK